MNVRRSLQMSLAGLLAMLVSCPAILEAGLTLNGGNELIGAQGGLNDFGNLSSDYRTFNSTDIHGFPSSGSYTARARAASASLDFLYTQTGDMATLRQSITESHEGGDVAQAEHRFTIEFTALNDLAFQFTSNYNGLGAAGTAEYYVTLMDLTTLGAVFTDNSQDPLDMFPVEDHVGALLAGHNYSLNGASRLYAGNPGSGVPASASGTYVFTTSPLLSTPEPGSLALAGIGTLCLIVRGRLRTTKSPRPCKTCRP
jgi:hypothetical protein